MLCLHPFCSLSYWILIKIGLQSVMTHAEDSRRLNLGKRLYTIRISIILLTVNIFVQKERNALGELDFRLISLSSRDYLI